MVDVNRFIMLLKQTKLVPAPKINEIKTIVKKMNRGLKLNIKQQAIYADIATRASVDPMTNNLAIFALTKGTLKRENQ
jgi:hypothetical protein